MRQIIPFKKDILFKTKICEITSISLEHNYNLEDDMISGEFIINGDYKMTEGSINREDFYYKIPFDIAIDSRYIKDSIVVDIDNFYYEILNNDTLQLNIDLYVEFEKEENINNDEIINPESIRFEDLVEEIESNIVDELPLSDDVGIDSNFNIFDNIDNSETYKAYYVYIVKEEDTIEKIIERYKVTKEELAIYNDIDNIKYKDKIIIPAKNE